MKGCKGGIKGRYGEGETNSECARMWQYCSLLTVHQGGTNPNDSWISLHAN